MIVIRISKFNLFKEANKFILNKFIELVLIVIAIVVGAVKLNYIGYLLGLPILIYFLIKSIRCLTNIMIDIYSLDIDRKTGVIFEITEKRYETGICSKYCEVKLSANKTYLLYSKENIDYKIKSRVEITYLRRSKIIILCNEV